MPVVPREGIDDDYRVGYVAGMTLGDGTFRYQPGWRYRKGFPLAYWRVALVDTEPLERLRDYLRVFGVEMAIRPFSSGSPWTRKPMLKIETLALPKLDVIYKLVEGERSTRGYQRGFLAGFFDAEGSNSDSVRISQVDIDVLDRVAQYARSIGFELKLERREGVASQLRLVGSVTERIRWFSVLEPAISRKREAIFGTMPSLDPEPIEAIEAGPVRDVVDIQTSTGTFYAAGLATHNCYARPTHEYLGLSAGLDFETHILVKEDAPALLEKALRAPSWQPEVVAISGVTDPYQPVERRLRITRGCLAVLAKYRNPCVIVTKSGLVTRDIDLLRELAEHDAVVVNVSITSLDDEIRRVMEPRASPPHERLRAVEALAKAGVPVGVMVAPIVPGLTDSEIPALVAAAARAGARTVHSVMLRLPHGVADLFEAWLARHFPDRAAKVMSRVSSLRGGRRNDPRFHTRMRGEGVFADQIADLFELACRRAGVNVDPPKLSTAAFRRPGGEQLALL
jgi:DNA repair photolyase